ncbi:hypothetical protein BDB00DRAFT_769242 [Zychaea mexicana]|uniref:uncharacterized protein n=1 Tax=Zychaea mexicana TaxID=64656 RepID=UPI0022FE419A|nr:uncharacterized protein BDB00DRAFT_769242 [Zychaea mexicana]KAI9490225.1 hypothetical protein BDB00DRAFT_769242 [Zychaea mexicana]
MGSTFAAYTAAHGDAEKQKCAQAPQRIAVTTDMHKVLFMPSRLNTTTSIKVVSVPLGDSKGGLPGTTLVLDEATGGLQTVMNAAALTAVRTAAGSALATQYYAKEDAKSLVVLGAGAQGRAHIDMVVAVRPSIQNVTIWNRGQERRDQLVREIQAAYPNLTVKGAGNDAELEPAARDADIVCTCTNATQPILRGEWLKEDVHLNCVGSYRLDMHEIDAQCVKQTDKILVDSVEACTAESGELVASSTPEKWTELGKIVIENQDAKADSAKRTLFKSVGISVQDSAIAGLMAKRAADANLGSVVPY